MSIESFNQPPQAPTNLVDGQFLVHRSDGTIEQGWNLGNVYDEQLVDGTIQKTADIFRPDEQNPREGLVKSIPLGRLENWQVAEEEPKLTDLRPVHAAQAAIAISEQNYDHLFRYDEAEENNALDVSGGFHAEVARNPRLEQIFTPVPTIDMMPSGTKTSYDFLWAEGEQYDAKLAEYQAESRQRQADERKYSVVTDASRAAAVERLSLARRTDRVIDSILKRYEQQATTEPVSAVDMIRTNADLRYDLGSYLYTEKLNARFDKMPSRVRLDDDKTPNSRGYGFLPRNLKSREYSTLIALAMIDGTFNKPGPGEAIERNSTGQVTLGMHRAAAEELLS
jgi:hypothetical protein